MNIPEKRAKSTAFGKKCNPSHGPTKHRKGPTKHRKGLLPPKRAYRACPG